MRTVSAASPQSIVADVHHHKLDSFDAIRSSSPAQLAVPAASAVLINELDSDTPGIDTAQLSWLVLPIPCWMDSVWLLLTAPTILLIVPILDGRTLNANGYFVVGNAGVANVGLTVANSALQNGPDAVALYEAAACTTIFPNNTAVTTANLVDAIVYDTGTTIEHRSAPLLNVGQTQVNEAANADSANQSNARCPDGSGGARNTIAYSQVAPSPGRGHLANADNADPNGYRAARLNGNPHPNPYEYTRSYAWCG